MTERPDMVAAWLRRLGSLTGSNMSLEDARQRVEAYADMLRGKYPASAFTRESLEAVAAESKFFPSYGEVCQRLTALWTKPAAPPQPAIAGAKAGAGYWHGFIASRLVGGGDRAHLLSLARTYATPDELAGIMAAFYPAEARAAADHAAEIKRDKARATEAVTKAVAASLSRPKPAKPSAMPEPEAPKPAVDPHAPGRPLTLPELRAKLAVIEREAKGNDPPPNAAGRIAMLQERIAELARPKEATA
jgi:hypothetical protein